MSNIVNRKVVARKGQDDKVGVTLKLESTNNSNIVRIEFDNQVRLVSFEKTNVALDFMRQLDCYAKLKTATQLNLTGRGLA